MKTIQDLQARMTALEQQKATAPAAAAVAVPAAAAWAPVVSVGTRAEDGVPDPDKARVEFYGQAMIDTIYDFKRMNPDWQATLRPSQIPIGCPGSPGCGKDGDDGLQRPPVESRVQVASSRRASAWSRPT